MTFAQLRRSLALAFAGAVGACTSSEPAAPAKPEAPPAERAPAARIGPYGAAYPKEVACPSDGTLVSVFAGDLARLGIIGVSIGPEGATPLEHYRSAAADLEAKTIAELVRLHGAGLVKCGSADCRGDESCQLFVARIHPSAPDADARGALVPDDPAQPKRWKVSADHRTCSYATSAAGAAATAVFQLTVGCKGCGAREEK